MQRNLQAVNIALDVEAVKKATQEKWDVINLIVEDEEEDLDAAKEIIVKGCGLAEVNGSFKRDGDFEGAPQYSKKMKWRDDVRLEIRGELKQGEDVEFSVKRFPDHSLAISLSNGW